MFTERGENYILVGPGRWGSSDTALGIPVKWPHISNSKLIVETALAGYHIEPSQGTHFFQNLTSFGVGYFTINPSSKGINFDFIPVLYKLFYFSFTFPEILQNLFSDYVD